MTCIPPLDACAVLVTFFLSGHIGESTPMPIDACSVAQHRTGLPKVPPAITNGNPNERDPVAARCEAR